MINAKMTYEYRKFGQARPSGYVIILCAFRKDPRYLVFSMETVTTPLSFEAETDTSRVKCTTVPQVKETGRTLNWGFTQVTTRRAH